MAGGKSRWDDEMFSGQTPSVDIPCKTCIFQLDTVVLDDGVYERYTGSVCQIYKYPESKPYNVLWEGAKCEQYKERR